MNELLSLLAEGGWVMYPLVVATVVLWYCLGWRLFALRRSSDLIVEGRTDLQRLLTADADGNAIEASLMRTTQSLSRYRAIVKSIVITAPLVGLLGTVGGMIETFDALGEMSLFTQSGGIAGGIAQALLTTQMGLAVAIPGLIFGRVIDRRQDAVVDSLYVMGGRV